MKEKAEELRNKVAEVNNLVKELNAGGVSVEFEVSNYKKGLIKVVAPAEDATMVPFNIEVSSITVNTQL